MQPRLLFPWFLFLFSACASNQDQWRKGRPKVVPVEGTIMYKGAPLADATVTFTNTATSTTAYAHTAADGKFIQTTFVKGDGAAPGKQDVAVRKVLLIDKAKGLDTGASSEIPPLPEERWQIPQKFGSAQTSGLGLEIPESGNKALVIELKD
ncbi:MAG: hypothetical protein EXR99_14035 [Gemmataceae bacterium]|nr:hypothetical protein [Gemmataceae bacterium]